MQAIFPQEYLLYFKGKWGSTGQKEPLLGRFGSFQIHPKYMIAIFTENVNCFSFFFHNTLRKSKESRLLVLRKVFFIPDLTEFCYGHAVLALAVDAQTEALDELILFQGLLDSGTQRAGSLAVDDAHGT